MPQRIDALKVAPEAYRALYGVERYLRESGLEASLLHLVKMRASQINGCAYCLDMHSKDARAGGETEQRLYELDAWREAPFYTERERAALAWTEALTLITQGHVPDEVYEQVRQQFTEKELVDLTLAIRGTASRSACEPSLVRTSRPRASESRRHLHRPERRAQDSGRAQMPESFRVAVHLWHLLSREKIKNGAGLLLRSRVRLGLRDSLAGRWKSTRSGRRLPCTESSLSLVRRSRTRDGILGTRGI